MGLVWCYECAKRHGWPPCDLRADGSAIDPLPCGHRRWCRGPDGCRECARLRGQLARLRRALGKGAR